MLIHLRTVDKAHAIQLHIAQKPTFGETNIERPDEFEANRRRGVTIRYVQTSSRGTLRFIMGQGHTVPMAHTPWTKSCGIYRFSNIKVLGKRILHVPV